MMRALRHLLLATVVGVVLGLAATWFMVTHGKLPNTVTDGSWHTSLAIGSADGNALTRALVAVHGLFALKHSETLYYNATTDDSGQRLDGRCTYRITGRDPATRWWSITAYGADDFLIPSADKRYAVSKNSVVRTADGRFTIVVSAHASAANWIAVKQTPFSLTLRLYNPAKQVAADPAHAHLPRIKRVQCQ